MSNTELGLTGNSEDMAHFFDTRAATYEQHMQQTVDDCSLFYRGMAEALPDMGSAPSILNLGVGTGLELEDLFTRFPQARVTGIDLSTGMLDELRRKGRPWAENLHLIIGSFLDLDLGSNQYDAVMSSMALHHWVPRVKHNLYRRICSALSATGTFVNGDFIVSKDESAQRLAAFEAAQLDARHQLHIDLPLSLEQEHQLLAEAGFSWTRTTFQRSHVAILVASKTLPQQDVKPEQQ